jgi:hypothetical protein
VKRKVRCHKDAVDILVRVMRDGIEQRLGRPRKPAPRSSAFSVQSGLDPAHLYRILKLLMLLRTQAVRGFGSRCRRVKLSTVVLVEALLSSTFPLLDPSCDKWEACRRSKGSQNTSSIGKQVCRGLGLPKLTSSSSYVRFHPARVASQYLALNQEYSGKEFTRQECECEEEAQNSCGCQSQVKRVFLPRVGFPRLHPMGGKPCVSVGLVEHAFTNYEKQNADCAES